jgi:RNA polymerase-interacting CarD/CdnL/TRCF family regulator
VKALKYFRVYVLQSNIIVYVPSAAIKDILIQPDIDGRRSKWIAKILEFDHGYKAYQINQSSRFRQVVG